LLFVFFVKLLRLPISILFPYTTLFRSLFPSRFKNLKLCHWIDIICKHNKALNSYQQMTLRNKITHECKASFFLSGDVRFSFKKRSEEHTSELQSRENLVCRLLLEKKKQ